MKFQVSFFRSELVTVIVRRARAISSSRVKAQFAVTFLLCVLSCTAAGATVNFKPAVTYPVGINPEFLLAADFNGDGKPDLAVSNRNSSDISILLGNGDGTFRNAPDLAVIGAIAAGDFNGDHKDDLLVNAGSSLNLFLSKGDGTFLPGVAIAVNGGYSYVADFNLDGHLDLINGSTILLGNGDGTFQPPLDSGAGTVLLVGDLNADGRPDLLTVTGVMLGNGDGTFQTAIGLPQGQQCVWPCEERDSNYVSADFDGDGNVDLAVGTMTRRCIDNQCSAWAGGNLTYLYGNGDGTFRLAAQNPIGDVGLPCFLLAADFNRDGIPDLAVAPTLDMGSSMLYFVVGANVVQYDIGSGPLYLIAADLNGDGFPDIVTADYTDNHVSVILNLPPDFTMPANLPTLVVARGQQGSEKFSIGSQAGFSDTVVLTCSVTGPAPTPTCSVAPSSVLPGDTAELTVNTGASRASVSRGNRHLRPFLAILFPLALVGFVFIRSSDGRRLGLLCSVMLVGTAIMLACGGGNNVSPPLATSYTITVTGTSGSIQHSATAKLTVQ